MEGDEEKT